MRKIIYIIFVISILILAGCGSPDYCIHEWREIERIEADCTQIGMINYECNLCKKTSSVYTEAPFGHKYGELIIVKEGKCNDKYEYKQICVTCGYEMTYSREVGDHQYHIIDIIQEATCTTEGKQLSQCYYCKDEKIETFTLDHEFRKNQGENIDATCTNDGLILGSSCIMCGLVEVENQIIPKLKHDYVNGKCTMCESPITYNINFYDGDNLYHQSSIQIDKLTDFSNILPQNNPSNSGYMFTGWYTKDNILLDENLDLVTIADEDYNINIYSRQNKIFEINNQEDFLKLSENSTSYCILNNDIDLRGATLSPIENFSGYLIGNNHTIKNFNLTTSTINSNFGIFKTNSGTIKDINISDFTININLNKVQSSSTSAVLAGVNQGVIENVNMSGVAAVTLYFHNTNATAIYGNLVGKNIGTIKSTNVDVNTTITLKSSSDNSTYKCSYILGGVVGINEGSIELAAFKSSYIVESRLSGTTTGFIQLHYYIHIANCLGGIAGRNNKKITDSHVNGSLRYNNTVLYNGSDKVNLGGISGENINGAEIRTSYVTGSINGSSLNESHVGGITGKNDSASKIVSCYSAANITSANNTNDAASTFGGIVGYNNASIQASYSACTIKSYVNSSTGGLAGKNSYGGTISKSFTLSNITTTIGSVNKFTCENSGIINKSYQSEDITLVNGNAAITGVKIQEMDYIELISKENLIDNLYWDQEDWYIGSDGNPFLNWEFLYSHNYSTPTIYEPTCTSAGITVYECLDCGKTFFKNITPALGHTPSGEKIESKTPTHEEDGYETYNCTEGHTFTVIIPKLGHNIPSNISCYDEKITIENDSYYYLCECNSKIKVSDDSIKHKASHVSYLAPSCGAYNEESLEWEGEALGQTQGSKCENCDLILFGCKVIEPHIFEEMEVVEEATCTKAGTTTYKCKLCEKESTLTTPILEHTYLDTGLKCSICETEKYEIDDSFYEISNYEELIEIVANPYGKYYLTQDIDLKEKIVTPLFSKENPFKGILLGNGYKISNLNLDSKNTSTENMALITYNEGTIAGITLENISVTANIKVGIISMLCANNNGEIFMCNITGNNNVSLYASVYSTSLDEIITGYNYSYGSICAINNKDGSIINCNVSGTMHMKYVAEALLESKNVSGFFDKLLNITKVENNVTFTSGGLVGINHGIISNSSFAAMLSYSTTTDSYVGGLNRGKTFLYVSLNDAGFVGINTGEIINSKSIIKKYNYHSYPDNCYIYDDPIKINKVIIKQEYEKIVDYSSLGEYQGLIGTNTGNIIELIQILDEEE